MAKYLVTEKSFVDGSLAEAGTTIDYTPPEGTTVSGNLVPATKKNIAALAETAPDAAQPDPAAR